MIIVAYICLASIFLPILYTIHKFGTLVSTKIASNSYTGSSLSTGFTMFRANGMNPAVLSPSHGHHRSHHLHPHHHHHHDHRPILDNLSTSSANSSSNNESFLAVGGNPNNRLLVHNNGRPVSKGKKKSSGAEGGSRDTRSKSKLKDSSSGGGMIFSPVTNTYSYSCNSPNCNFKLQSRSGARITPYTNQGTTVSNQINTSVSEGHPSHRHPHHLLLHNNHPVSYATHPSFNLPAHHASRFSLFRTDLPSVNRFASSLHSNGMKGGDAVATTTNSSYNRLNPLFETTEGSFRSAYP